MANGPEQQNWIRAMVQTGAKAQRVYVLSVQQEFDKACGRETHILAPETADGMPRLNEKAMRVYDNMIAEADKQGLRLILPFIDHWWWWGGREQLAAFYHEKRKTFIGPIARPSKPIWM
nr:Endo-beta-mannanase [Klebsiella pneumoniae]